MNKILLSTGYFPWFHDYNPKRIACKSKTLICSHVKRPRDKASGKQVIPAEVSGAAQLIVYLNSIRLTRTEARLSLQCWPETISLSSYSLGNTFTVHRNQKRSYHLRRLTELRPCGKGAGI